VDNKLKHEITKLYKGYKMLAIAAITCIKGRINRVKMEVTTVLNLE
jgi:hypothetical protein